MSKIINRVLLLVLLVLIVLFAYKLLSNQNVLTASAKTTVEVRDIEDHDGKLKTQQIIKEYLLENPEVIVDALNQLQKKKMEEMDSKVNGYIHDQKSEIEDQSSSFIIGNPKAELSIVYFFDYNCGYCKKGFTALKDLIASDKDVKIIMRPIPILGESSGYVTKIAFAASIIAPDKFHAFHNELFTLPQINKEAVDKLLLKHGISQQAISEALQKPEIGNLIHRNLTIAENLRIQGSPAYIIDDKFFPGLLELSQLQKTIAESRTKQETTK